MPPFIELVNTPPLDLVALFGVELERHTCDLDVVARLKALILERADHADTAQPPLEVRQRVLVLEVIARDEPFDAPAA